MISKRLLPVALIAPGVLLCIMAALFGLGFGPVARAPVAESADPEIVLLAEFNSEGGGSWRGQHQVGPAFVTLCLGYDQHQTGACLDPRGYDAAVGGNIPAGTWSVVYDASNSPDFGAVASRATNGQDELLWTAVYVFHDGSGDVFTGGADGGDESPYFGCAPDLEGSTILFIRVIVHQLEVEVDDDGFGYEEQHDVTWQFFGVGEPCVTSPVGGTTELLVGGNSGSGPPWAMFGAGFVAVSAAVFARKRMR